MHVILRRSTFVSNSSCVILAIVTYLGSTVSGGKDMAEVNFNIDSGYSCDIFTSCKQESFSAQAGISSSLAFLDFLGVNG